MGTLPSASSIANLDSGEVPGKEAPSIRCVQFMGYPIFVGRNAASNDKLISTHRHKNCLWFHVSCAKGAHVVLCIEGRAKPEEDSIVMRRAAALALQFSKSPSKEVSWSPLIDVFRPEHANAGVFMTWRTTTISL